MNDLKHLPSQKTLTLFGASRGIGLELLVRSLRAGHQVRALVRDPSAFNTAVERRGLSPDALARLSVVQGDALREDDVRRAVRGADAVLSALGAPARSDSRIRSEGTSVIARAMQKEGVDRIVAVSVYGVAETRASLPFFLRYVIFPFYLNKAVAEHERQEQVLEQSGLAWTAVRPPNLVDREDDAELVHGLGVVPGMSMEVSRGEVAAFMLNAVEHNTYVYAAPAIARAA
jgi:uncharacterized protein YbjT (DUF2867 family)